MHHRINPHTFITLCLSINSISIIIGQVCAFVRVCWCDTFRTVFSALVRIINNHILLVDFIAHTGMAVIRECRRSLVRLLLRSSSQLIRS